VKEILVVRFRGTRGINPWNPGRYLKWIIVVWFRKPRGRNSWTLGEDPKWIVVVDLWETRFNRSRTLDERIMGESEGWELKPLNPGLSKKITTIDLKGTRIDRS
jgi:hypothetical protein